MNVSTAPVTESKIEDEASVLDCLFWRQERSDSGWCTSSEVSDSLMQKFGKRIHHNTVRAVLKRKRTSVARRKREGKWYFRSLAGRLQDDRPQIQFLQPNSVAQNVLSLHALLKTLTGHILICDPYTDEATLEHLCAIPLECHIDLLTNKVDCIGPFRRVLAAMKADGHLIEVRCASSRSLHDRYIVDDQALLIIGTSLNQFGRKQTFITQAGPEVRSAVVVAFYEEWRNANPVGIT